MAGRDLCFEIVKQIGVLKENITGWKKEINVVVWNGGEPKYDIREWDANHERMSRGITLNEEEMKNLLSAMAAYNAESK